MKYILWIGILGLILAAGVPAIDGQAYSGDRVPAAANASPPAPAVPAAATGPGANPPLRRVALFIGSNGGGSGRITLRYAEEDARTMAAVMQELGGVAARDSLVLLAPTPEDVLDGFRAIGRQAQRAREGARRVEFLLYYSGHSDEQGLLLGGERVDYPRLRSAIQEVQADVNIAILDSCSSGAFTRLKGGTRQPPFLLDESAQMKGHAYLSSSSADEAAQESDNIRGSFFTHYLVSGLRGAADATRDGQISLNEVYHFAFNETLARTENTQGGAQHPSYNIQLTGTGDLTLTDLRAAPCGLLIEEPIEGRLFIRNAQGRLVAELRKDPGVRVELGLPEGRYTVVLDQGPKLYQASLAVRAGLRQTLGLRQLVPARREPAAARGDAWVEAAHGGAPGPAMAEAGEPEVVRMPFSIGIVPFVSSTGGGRHEYTLSVNLLMGNSYAIDGAELAGVMNITEARVRGVQAAGVGNILGGDLRGLQAAGVFNIVAGDAAVILSAGVFNIVQGEAAFLQSAGVFNINAGPFSGILSAGVFNIGHSPVSGLQAAGVFNINEGPVAGAQVSGVFNVVGALSGAQVGLVNIASGDVRGAQVGLVNIASGDVRGAQVGLVNVSRRLHGLPVGLINVSRLGGYHLSGWVTRGSLGYVGLQMAAGPVYTLLYGGAGLDSPALFAAGAGLGLGLPLGHLRFEADLSLQHVFEGSPQQWEEGFRTAPYAPVFPTIRTTLGVRALGPLFLFGGLVLDGHIPGVTVETPLHTGDPLDLTLGTRHLMLYPRLLAGIRI